VCLLLGHGQCFRTESFFAFGGIHQCSRFGAGGKGRRADFATLSGLVMRGQFR
jgi:hypothetical protein